MDNLKAAFAVCLALLALAPAASAQAPDFPYLPWGTVTINGVLAPDRSIVEAYIDGRLHAGMRGGTINGYYSLAIPGNSSLEGKEVIIMVNTVRADQSLTWRSGVSERKDLAVTNGTYCGDGVCQEYEDCACSDCRLEPGCFSGGQPAPGPPSPPAQDNVLRRVRYFIAGLVRIFTGSG